LHYLDRFLDASLANIWLLISPMFFSISAPIESAVADFGKIGGEDNAAVYFQFRIYLDERLDPPPENIKLYPYC
jgi:hypothetical protein